MGAIDSKKDVFRSFPRRGVLSALGGAQAKVAVVKVGDKYVAPEVTDVEHESRFEYCYDLAQQLVAYCERKATENPDWSQLFNYERAAKGLRQKSDARIWDIDSSELAWMLEAVRSELRTRGWAGIPA